MPTGRLMLPAYRHGHRSRSLMGTFGQTEIEVPRARLDNPDGKTTEWREARCATHVNSTRRYFVPIRLFAAAI